MAIYAESVQNQVVRQTAKDLLIRAIYEHFPEGWTSSGDIGPAVKLGSWDYEIGNYVQDSSIAHFAKGIMKHLAIDYPPPEGWKPHLQNDPLIDELFDRYWPMQTNDAARR